MQWLLIETAWRKSCSRLSAYPQLTLLSKHCGLYACWDGRWPSSWNCNGVSHAESTCEGCVLPFWRVKLVGRDFTKCIFINREHAAHVRDFLLAVFVRWLSRSIFSVLAGADNEHRHDFDSVCVSSWLVGTSRCTCEVLTACGFPSRRLTVVCPYRRRRTTDVKKKRSRQARVAVSFWFRLETLLDIKERGSCHG